MMIALDKAESIIKDELRYAGLRDVQHIYNRLLGLIETDCRRNDNRRKLAVNAVSDSISYINTHSYRG